MGVTVEFKFEPGDIVIMERRVVSRKEVSCEVCEGSGEVIIKNRKYSCPECKGKGVVIEINNEIVQEEFEIAECKFDGYEKYYSLTKPGNSLIEHSNISEASLKLKETDNSISRPETFEKQRGGI